MGGIERAEGKYVIMGDADDSYDFEKLDAFVARLRDGADVVMGNRFKGGISPGAMPFLHRYLGNPVLSFLGRLFYKIPTGDFHCGLRGFNRSKIMDLGLRTTGMEFASEMVVRASLANYRIDEVPTTLRQDGRSRPPHLRTWRDGWRHLSFLLMYSPRYLFLYPGLVFLVFGLLASIFLLPGSKAVAGVAFDIHTLIAASFSAVIGIQAISFAALTRRLASAHKMLPESRYSRILNFFTLERILVCSIVMLIFGLGGVFWSLSQWAATGFGELQYKSVIRVLTLSAAACTIAIQLGLTAFFFAAMEVPAK
jgi:glycosyltransferase involved in cell wall biosynthesis